MSFDTTSQLDPKLLGFWAKCIREASHWSQEALAASAGLDVRTIQRIEAGKSVSISTRRSLARGLGYEKHDVFEDPEFAATISGLIGELQAGRQKNLDAQFPEFIRLSVARVVSGDALCQLADVSEGTLLHMDDGLSLDAKQTTAALFDFLRDLSDISSDVSFTEKLEFGKSLNAMLKELEKLGAAAFSAIRSTKMVGVNWADKTPMPIAIGYLTIVPSERTITEIMVPRRLS
jgi:transcriptional regulator with XRE-family HTH domain